MRNSQKRSNRRRNHSDRRGAILVLVCISVIVLLFMAALSVDVAKMQLARTELRTATDAAARAAAATLAREQDMNLARQAAIDAAAANTVAGDSLILDPSDIVFGKAQFSMTGPAVFTAGGTPYNAAQVQGRRTDGSPSGGVNLFFGGIFGVDRFQPTQQAVAARLDRDIALVLDHSGSMNTDNRWQALSDALDVFLTKLEDTPQVEFVSLIGYSSSASEYQELTPNMQDIRDAFGSLSPAGYTAIGDGLTKGSDSLAFNTATRPFASKTIVIMTDGNHNTGDGPDITVQTAIDRGHTVHTITFSAGANQTLMASVAASGGGIHLHAPDALALAAAFNEIAGTLPVLLTE